MNRRTFISSLAAGSMTLSAGCLGGERENPEELTVPALFSDNHETEPATVSVILTDSAETVHLWETVELDARTAETGGSVDTHEFEQEWLKPRDYRLYAKWVEGDQTNSTRLGRLPLAEECVHVGIEIDDGVEFISVNRPCPGSEESTESS